MYEQMYLMTWAGVCMTYSHDAFLKVESDVLWSAYLNMSLTPENKKKNRHKL